MTEADIDWQSPLRFPVPVRPENPSYVSWDSPLATCKSCTLHSVAESHSTNSVSKCFTSRGKIKFQQGW